MGKELAKNCHYLISPYPEQTAIDFFDHIFLLLSIKIYLLYRLFLWVIFCIFLIQDKYICIHICVCVYLCTCIFLRLHQRLYIFSLPQPQRTEDLKEAVFFILLMIFLVFTMSNHNNISSRFIGHTMSLYIQAKLYPQRSPCFKRSLGYSLFPSPKIFYSFSEKQSGIIIKTLYNFLNYAIYSSLPTLFYHLVHNSTGFFVFRCF